MTDDRVEQTTEKIMLIRQGAERIGHQFDGTFNTLGLDAAAADGQR